MQLDCSTLRWVLEGACPVLIKVLLSSLCLDEYACLWNGCEFLAMGSPAELEVHAYFHNYHSKLKFIGSQLLKAHPDLPSCNQGSHSNNLLPEGSDGYVCQWEHCDVGIFTFHSDSKMPL